jgi:hypothetical protein
MNIKVETDTTALMRLADKFENLRPVIIDMLSPLTMEGLQSLREKTPRGKKAGPKLADAWGYQIASEDPIKITLLNAVREKWPILRYLEKGTVEHPIYPRRAAALRFFWMGRIRFFKMVTHPGHQAYEMVARTRALLIWRVAEMQSRMKETIVSKVTED